MAIQQTSDDHFLPQALSHDGLGPAAGLQLSRRNPHLERPVEPEEFFAARDARILPPRPAPEAEWQPIILQKWSAGVSKKLPMLAILRC